MTGQEKLEIIKAFAYGKTGAEVAVVTGMTLREANAFQRENEEAIAKKKAELREAGYIG